jgi:DNA repair exonuclease SbcCD ATPase subunit
MNKSAASRPMVRLHASNVGGIDETSVELQPGVNVLVGRNATNRTSFLQAVMAALGSDRASLKGDAETGSVELEFGDETYERQLRRVGGDVVLEGGGVLEDSTLADLYAFLLESNEARRAVARSDDLREIIVRPVDTADLRTEIDHLESTKRDLDRELDDLDDVEARLTNRQRRVEELEREREELRADLEEAREALDEAESQAGDESGPLAELKSVRSDLEDVRFRLRTERESLESLREERTDLQAALDDLPAGDADLADLEERIESLRERRTSIDAELNELQNVVRFNEDLLSESGGVHADIVDAVDEENKTADGSSDGTDSSPRSDGGTVTDALLDDNDEAVCWTCGSSVPESAIESTVERLRDLREQKRAQKTELTEELETLTQRLSEAEDAREERASLESSLSDVEVEIEERKERVESLEAERDELESDVSNLEAAVEDAGGHQAAVNRAKRVNELSVELERVEADLADARETVASLEAQLEEREQLAERRADVVESLSELRDRVDQLERDAVEAFNDHMETVLDRLGYENIERIWIERTTESAGQRRHSVDDSEFDLHVVRSSDDGAAYEDTVDHLSESEREVTGLVFALAGYLVHDVHEDVPFVLLDSLEAIDSQRIATLVDYVGEYAQFLVVALLPEDAEAVESVDNRVTDI